MLERRRTERKPTADTGRVAFGRGPHIECMVRNISPGGARLVFPTKRTRLPKQFVLAIDGEWNRRACQLVWRSGFRVGVRFVSGN